MTGLLLGAWRFRHYILSAIRADFAARVSRSRLGVLWIVIAPMTQVAIYAVVLSAIMSARLPGIDSPFAYAIYLLSGFAAWTLFAELFGRGTTLFLENANALRKIVFPRIALPVILLGSCLVNNLVLVAAVLVAYLLLGHGWSASLLWLPVLVAVNAALALALGTIAGVLNVFMRDVGQIVPLLLQLGFWFTPVVYMETILPEPVRAVLALNPMYWVVRGYHDALAYGRMPDLAMLALIGVIALVLLAFALLLFRRASADMVDVL
ncbi:ABC transporter permease [Salinarimonas ramus]|uniref:Transport permease protein n=1 Tax=Salinarimonas ramus TaxID=690164 RepID=A0A917V7B5_9HYPH|nr:ABC transporter permease [Salinarimonas ramus]GGK47142.1 transport permease protein [Salinarimonas ramus]